MTMQVDVKVDGKVIATVNIDERGKKNPFSSGSIGYHGNGKISINDKVHQANILFTEVGTKGKYSK